MPEGPEVRKTAHWLKGNVGGCIIRSVDVVGGRFVKQPIERLEELKGNRCVNVRCGGKVIVLDFETDVSAVSTLGMSGLWSRADHKHAALRLGCELPPTRGIMPVYFVDQRRFGNFKVMATREATSKLDELGWDALAEPETYGKALIALDRCKQTKQISEILLDQSIFAGVGNYIRSEALRRALLSPWRTLISLSMQDKILLCEVIKRIMQESYNAGGAQLRDYRVDDVAPSFQFLLWVYGRTFDPNGNRVERTKANDGRTVWWCPSVQV